MLALDDTIAAIASGAGGAALEGVPGLHHGAQPARVGGEGGCVDAGMPIGMRFAHELTVGAADVLVGGGGVERRTEPVQALDGDLLAS